MGIHGQHVGSLTEAAQHHVPRAHEVLTVAESRGQSANGEFQAYFLDFSWSVMAIFDYGKLTQPVPYPSKTRRGSFQAVAGLMMEEGEKSFTKPFTK